MVKATVPPRRCRASYGDLAAEFDFLFPDPDELARLEASSLHAIFGRYGVRSVLDCACGTGIQTLGLAMLGYDVAASDISRRMVEVLDRKAKDKGLAVPSHQADFRRLGQWPGRTFDAVICGGGSLTLVPRREEMAMALARMASVVTPGGLVVVGLHNYMLLREQGEEFVLRRPFRAGTSEVAFDVREFGAERAFVTHTFAHLDRGRWHVKSSTKSHHYVTAAELRSLMLASGCTSVELLDVTGQHQVREAEWVLAVGQTERGDGAPAHQVLRDPA
jgi:ubiquinone/menaquinone biosynthesis C-methylase UbiE